MFILSFHLFCHSIHSVLPFILPFLSFCLSNHSVILFILSSLPILLYICTVPCSPDLMLYNCLLLFSALLIISALTRLTMSSLSRVGWIWTMLLQLSLNYMVADSREKHKPLLKIINVLTSIWFRGRSHLSFVFIDNLFMIVIDLG